LQASKEHGLNQILVTSTSETYGTAQYVPIDEIHPVVGQSPYSATKIAADQLAISFYRSFNLPVKIVRPFNTYGPRQSARAIIPTIISQLLSGKEKLSLGNLSPTRDLTYVKDTCKGFLEIFKTDKLFGEITNIGMGNEISVGELVKKINFLISSKAIVEEDTIRVRPENSEVERLLCNNTKLISNTNWKPDYNLETGLLETIEWLKANIDLYKVDIYNV
jgi:nucleoside-diphosphate-sugar epimerase